MKLIGLRAKDFRSDNSGELVAVSNTIATISYSSKSKLIPNSSKVRQ